MKKLFGILLMLPLILWAGYYFISFWHTIPEKEYWGMFRFILLFGLFVAGYIQVAIAVGKDIDKKIAKDLGMDMDKK